MGLSMRLTEGSVHMLGGQFSLSGRLSVRDRATVEASGYWADKDAPAQGSLSGSGTDRSSLRVYGCPAPGIYEMSSSHWVPYMNLGGVRVVSTELTLANAYSLARRIWLT
jgi:hypothetical protein